MGKRGSIIAPLCLFVLTPAVNKTKLKANIQDTKEGEILRQTTSIQYTARWSNIVSIALGIVTAIYATAVLIIGVGTAGFIGLVIVGGIT
jgi:hypothetical protein